MKESFNRGIEEKEDSTEIIDVVQTGLDVVGLLPGIGEVCDAINAVIYMSRGDWVNAGISVVSCIPFADIVAKSGKYAKKGGKVAGAIAEGGLKAGRTVKKAKFGTKAFEIGEVLIKTLGRSDNAGALLKHTDDVGDVIEKVVKRTDDVAEEVLEQADEIAEAVSDAAKKADVPNEKKPDLDVGKGGLNSINKLDDLLVDPSKLAGVSGDELYEYLLKNGYDVTPLSKGSYKGIPFEEGGGFKVNWGGDRILQYHPADASHHGGAYFKISSGETGTIRIDLDGNIIE